MSRCSRRSVTNRTTAMACSRRWPRLGCAALRTPLSTGRYAGSSPRACSTASSCSPRRDRHASTTGSRPAGRPVARPWRVGGARRRNGAQTGQERSVSQARSGRSRMSRRSRTARRAVAAARGVAHDFAQHGRYGARSRRERAVDCALRLTGGLCPPAASRPRPADGRRRLRRARRFQVRHTRLRVKLLIGLAAIVAGALIATVVWANRVQPLGFGDITVAPAPRTRGRWGQGVSLAVEARRSVRRRQLAAKRLRGAGASRGADLSGYRRWDDWRVELATNEHELRFRATRRFAAFTLAPGERQLVWFTGDFSSAKASHDGSAPESPASPRRSRCSAYPPRARSARIHLQRQARPRLFDRLNDRGPRLTVRSRGVSVNREL